MATEIATTTTTVSEAPRRMFSVDLNTDYKADFARLLSSPITSYEVEQVDSNTFAVKHRLTYQERYKATKEKYETESRVFDELCQTVREQGFQRELDRRRLSVLEETQKLDRARIWDSHTRIWNLHGRLHTVEEERRAHNDTLLEWETKSRLAQGINDYYVFLEGSASMPRDAYKRLKAEGCGYLPYLLSAWAVFYNREPARRFIISREEEEAYTGRAESLVTKQLADSVELVWNSMESYDRSLMISAFIATYPPELGCSCKANEEAKSVVDSDPRFVREEIDWATFYIPTIVNECSEKLFDDAGRSN